MPFVHSDSATELDEATTELPTTIGAPVQSEVSLTFSLQESVEVGFSLICNSSGERVIGVVWTRDGYFLELSSPVIETDASTNLYTNTLSVHGRVPGTYICRWIGESNHFVNSVNLTVQGMALLNYYLLLARIMKFMQFGEHVSVQLCKTFCM